MSKGESASVQKPNREAREIENQKNYENRQNEVVEVNSEWIRFEIGETQDPS